MGEAKLETRGDFHNHLGTIPSNELNWKGNPCPRCGVPLDVFRNMATHQISRYICNNSKCGYMSGYIIAVCPNCGNAPQDWKYDPKARETMVCGNCDKSIPYKQYMTLELLEVKEEEKHLETKP